MENLSELIGKDLRSFKLETLHEVWSTDELGLRSKAIGAFRNETVARAFAGNEKGSWGAASVYPVTVLTDGINTFAIEDRVINVFNDEAEATKLRQAAIEKLSPADRKILGL